MEIIILVLFIIICVAIAYIADAINSKKVYLMSLELNLPTVAENVINDILSNDSDSTSVGDIFNFASQFMMNEDPYLCGIEFIKHKMLEYTNNYIDNTVRGKLVKHMLKSIINSDSQIITDALDNILTSNGSDGETMYNNLIKLLTNYSTDKLDSIKKEENEAAAISEKYENETVEDVAEYNGELDKSEFDIARENFVPVGNEYPDEENLDEIPEELVEIVASSEEYILQDQSD